jgi:hypothetical protein
METLFMEEYYTFYGSTINVALLTSDCIIILIMFTLFLKTVVLVNSNINSKFVNKLIGMRPSTFSLFVSFSSENDILSSNRVVNVPYFV